MNFNFEKYPFEKLRELFHGITPNTNYSELNLTIGEPKFETPQLILDAIKNSLSEFNKYPKTAGIEELNQAQRGFVKKRFSVELAPEELIPTLGTREVLFNFPQFFLFGKKSPTMAFTNPFYQIYEGAAKASRAEIVHINLTKENGFKPIIDEERLSQCDLVILNFPNNPTGVSLSVDELGEWVELALKHDFLLLNDECYSEIYVDEKPPSILEASIKVGNSSFKNVLALNSISKRSSAPGLRSGFIAGDSKILKEYMLYRTYAGATAGVPLQLGAAKAWGDFEHAEKIRNEYKRNLKIAKEVLEVDVFPTTFYVWLKVDDDLEVAQELLRSYNVKVLPGTFLSRGGVGAGFVRIALVEESAKVKEALKRIKEYLK